MLGQSVALIAGERYGDGIVAISVAAKGQRLLGIRAVLAA
jgi:aconitase A